MALKYDLIKMQNRFKKKPLKDIDLQRPAWLTPGNPTSYIFKDKTILLNEGTVCFAAIVQANDIMFKQSPHIDCGGQVVFSTDPFIAENPHLLQQIARQLYQYKNHPLESVPMQIRDIVATITDEYDNSSYTFSFTHQGHSMKIYFMPTILFRKLLPREKLCGNLLPILTAPDCKSVLVLPKQYWTRKFRFLWVHKMI